MSDLDFDDGWRNDSTGCSYKEHQAGCCYRAPEQKLSWAQGPGWYVAIPGRRRLIGPWPDPEQAFDFAELHDGTVREIKEGAA